MSLFRVMVIAGENLLKEKEKEIKKQNCKKVDEFYRKGYRRFE